MGVYSVGVYSLGVYNARATESGLGNHVQLQTQYNIHYIWVVNVLVFLDLLVVNVHWTIRSSSSTVWCAL